MVCAAGGARGILREASDGVSKRIVTKIVHWGRWAVGVIFILLGADTLVGSSIDASGLAQQHSRETMYAFVLAHAFLIWLPAFLCAWGVFKWRAWARRLGIALCAFFAGVGLGLWIYFQMLGRRDTPLFVMVLVAGTAFAWLILPSVGAEYSRRNQIA
jgi:drug/metabolite transporter (DMT)-like permease